MANDNSGAKGPDVSASNFRLMQTFNAAAGVEADIAFFPRRTADTEIITDMGYQFQATLYNKAGGASQTLRLYGRMTHESIVGDWVQIGTDMVTPVGAAFKSIALSDGVGGPNEFKVTRVGGDSASQAGVAFS